MAPVTLGHNLKILLISKYPPIQGGVSSKCFELAKTLGSNDCEVHVVTNANEVESGFRALLTAEDKKYILEQKNVKVYQTTWSSTGLAHIPFSNPFLSKILGISIELINEIDFDAIIGWYLQPYGIAAAIISELAGKPCILRHAGSDLGRLIKHNDLKPLFSWAIKKAKVIISNGSKNSKSLDILKAHGATEQQIFHAEYEPLPNYFLKPTIKTTFVQLIEEFRKNIAAVNLQTNLPRFLDKDPDPDLPTILIYGKVGRAKGWFDLVRALDRLVKEGLKFNFLAIAGGRPKTLQHFHNTINNNNALAQRTWVLPFVSPRFIPAAISVSDIVVCLEYDFPITFHMPSIPREVLAMGKCLICTEEVIKKQAFSKNMVPGKNFLQIKNPSDIDELSKVINTVVKQKKVRRSVGFHGKYVSDIFEKCTINTDAVQNNWKRALDLAVGHPASNLGIID